MNWYFYLAPDGSVVRVSAKAKPASYRSPVNNNVYVAEKCTGNAWAAIKPLHYNQLIRLSYIGWVNETV